MDKLHELWTNVRALSAQHNQQWVVPETIWLAILQSDDPAARVLNPETRETIIAQTVLQLKESGKGPQAGEPLVSAGAQMVEDLALLYAGKQGVDVQPCHYLLCAFSCDYPLTGWLKAQGWVFALYVQALKYAEILPDDVAVTPLSIPYDYNHEWVPSRYMRLFIGARRRNALIEKLNSHAYHALQLKDYRSAIHNADKAAGLLPGYPDLVHFRAYVYSQAGRYAAAAEMLRPLFRKDPGNSAVSINLSFCLGKMEKHEEELAVAREYYRHAPDDADANNNLGFLVAESGDWMEAIPYLDRALLLQPDYAFAMNNKGYCLFRLGRIAEAKEIISASLQIDKGNAYAFRNLALIAESEGNVPRAKELAERAFLFYYREDFGRDIDYLAG